VIPLRLLELEAQAASFARANVCSEGPDVILDRRTFAPDLPYSPKSVKAEAGLCRAYVQALDVMLKVTVASVEQHQAALALRESLLWAKASLRQFPAEYEDPP
jgi:hypothetical protein